MAVTSAMSATAYAEEDAAVPIGVQAELLAKVAAYDKNLPARAGDKVHVLVVKKDGSAESSRAAAQMERALSDSVKDIAGIPHDVESITFSSPSDLAQTIVAKHASIVWLTPGLGDDVPGIAQSLSGGDVLTVSAVASHVPKGAVLGFDLVSAKPKIVIHLGQAKKQHVAFSADVLKLARIYE